MRKEAGHSYYLLGFSASEYRALACDVIKLTSLLIMLLCMVLSLFYTIVMVSITQTSNLKAKFQSSI